MRKPFLAGNWKMNLDRASGRDLVRRLAEVADRREDVDVAVFPPVVYVPELVAALAESRIRVGAQSCCEHDSGAYTGEVSAAMLADVGAELVLCGHSERRHVYGEGDEQVNAKVHRALEAGLDVVLCVGETLEEREAGRTEPVVSTQLLGGLRGVPADRAARVTLAYEPVWAIGTGRTATSDQAGEVHAYLRGVLAGLYDEAVAAATRIQYGGSVKPDNIAELMAVPDVDGALVGGASLKAETFLPIVEFQRG